VGGDGIYSCIAAASILAKVSRDRFMLQMAEKYPQYAFEKHKGYGTRLHYERLREFGPSPIHRKTFLRKMH
jgi:ribonuclease HII